MTRFHDAVTRLGFYVACLAMLAILLTMNAEILLRYAFNSPTKWSADTVTYLLLAVIAFGMPEVTRTRGHIAITIIDEQLSSSTYKLVDIARNAATLVVVVATATIILLTAVQEFKSGVLTVAALQIPKWVLNSALAYGFISSALHLLRLLFTPTDRPVSSPAEEVLG